MADKNLGNLYYSLGLDDSEFNKKWADILKKVGKDGFSIKVNLDMSAVNTDMLKGLNKSFSESSAVQKQFNKVTDEVVQGQGRMRKGFELTNKTLLSTRTLAIQLSNQLGTMFSIYAVQGWVKQLAAARGEFELQEISLKAILRDGAAAETMFERIKGLAVVSPFEFKDLIAYTKQLSAFSVPVDELYGTMKSLADISAGLGVDMSRLVLAYGQVRSAAVLRGQELRQFTEAGIPLVDKLADKFTELEGRVVSAGEVFDKISRREVPFEMVKEVMEDLASVGGQFYQMQEKQAESLRGRIANLADAYAIMLNDIGKANDGLLKGGVDAIYAIINNWESVAKVLKTVIAAYGSYKAMLITVSAVQKAWTSINTVQTIVNAANALKGLTAATKAQALAQGALNAVSAVNPWTWVAVGVGVLVGAYFALRKEVESDIQIHDRYVKKLADQKNAMEEGANSLKGYMRLAKDETASMAERLNALEMLQKIYPEYFKNMDLEKLKLMDLSDALRSYNEDSMLRNVGTSGADLAAAKRNIDALKKQQEAYDTLNNVTGKGKFRAQAQIKMQALSPVPEAIMNAAEKEFNEAKDAYDKNMNSYTSFVTAKIKSEQEKWVKDVKEINQKMGKEGKMINIVPDFNPKAMQGFDDYVKELRKGVAEAKSVIEDVYSGKRPEYDEAAKSFDVWMEKVETGTKIMQKFGVAEKLTKSEKSKDPIAEKWEKRLELMREATDQYFQYRKAMGSAAAEEKVQSNDRFTELDFNIDGFRDQVLKAMDVLGDTKAQAKVKNAFGKLLDKFDMKMFQAKLQDQVKAVNRALDESEERWERFNRMFASTGDYQYSINLAFNGKQDYKSFADELNAKLQDAMQASQVMVPFAWDESQAKEAFGENGELLELWKRTKAAIQKDVVDLEKMIGEAIKQTLRGEDIRKSLEAQKTNALSALMEKGMGADSKEFKAVGKMWDEKIASAMFDDLKNTDIWAKTFENMERLSTGSLKAIIVELERFKATAGKDLSVEDFKSLMTTLNKLKTTVEGRNPFKALVSSMKEMREAQKDIKKYEQAIKDINTTSFEGLDGMTIGQVLDSSLPDSVKSMAKLQKVTISYKDSSGKTKKEVLSLADALKRLMNANDDVTSSEDKFKEAMGKIGEYAGYASDAVGNLSEMFDAMGNGSMAEAAGTVSDVFGSISNIGQGFAKGGLVGGIASAVGEAANWIGKIFSNHDSNLQKVIENSERAYKQIENLRNKIQTEIDYGLNYAGGSGNKDYTESRLKEYADRMEEIKGEIAEININPLKISVNAKDLAKLRAELDKLQARTDAANEGGAYGLQRQLMREQLAELEKQRAAEEDKKKTDKSKLADYDAQIQEMKNSILEFSETLADELYGINFDEWAGTLADALVGAFAAGEDAAQAFDDSVADMMRGVVTEMAKMYILKPAFDNLREYLFGENGDGGVFGSDLMLDEQDVIGMQGYFDDIKSRIPAVQELFDAINNGMGGLLSETQGVSDLSKGIQAVTEDTAQLLASYLNAIRQDVSITRAILSRMEGMLRTSNTTLAATLAELNNLNSTATAMLSILEATTTAAKSGGRGFKVVM